MEIQNKNVEKRVVVFFLFEIIIIIINKEEAVSTCVWECESACE